MNDSKIINGRRTVISLIESDSDSPYTKEDVIERWELGDIYEFLEERDYVWVSDNYQWEK